MTNLQPVYINRNTNIINKQKLKHTDIYTFTKRIFKKKPMTLPKVLFWAVS